MTTTDHSSKPNVVFHRDTTYLVISDLHMGHRNTTAKEMTEAMDEFFGQYKPDHAFASLDVIFIAGDLFDRALTFASNDIPLITGWIYRVMDFCKTHAIKLRVLEGTPSHDNFQSRNLKSMAERYAVDSLDFKYVETLHIETIEDLGLTVLYMPDEWAGSTQKAQEQVQALMASKGLQQVDIAIMHGMFTYQVPSLANDRLKHNEAFYLSIVRFFINIGHVHTFTTYERIIAQGSTDRICHGEEEAKGGVVCYLRKDGRHGFAFIENKHAKIYKTIHVKFLNAAKAQAQVTKVLDGLPDLSYVRIKAKEGHPILQGLQTFRQAYPMLNFAKITEEDDKESFTLIKEITGLEDDYVAISITRENLVDLVLDEVSKRYGYSPQQLQRLETLMKKIHK